MQQCSLCLGGEQAVPGSQTHSREDEGALLSLPEDMHRRKRLWFGEETGVLTTAVSYSYCQSINELS